LNLYHNLKKMQVFKLKEVEIHKIMKKKWIFFWKSYMHKLFWKPNNINALCWAFYHVNENKEIDLTTFQDYTRLPLRSPGTKWHLGAGPMAMHIEYYKGEGGGFLQVRIVVNLVNLCLFVACLCTKSVLATH
jgi:hypothetical protein